MAVAENICRKNSKRGGLEKAATLLLDGEPEFDEKPVIKPAYGVPFPPDDEPVLEPMYAVPMPPEKPVIKPAYGVPFPPEEEKKKD